MAEILVSRTIIEESTKAYVSVFECEVETQQFLPCRLQTRQWSDRVIRKEYREWKVRNGTIRKKVQVVVTPRVREEVQKHYGCKNLSGAELEDQGEEGTALTHWEKRLFEVCLHHWTFSNLDQVSQFQQMYSW